ncbi:hypothetical protein VTH06DRAFT_8190 [Thermothelomyces fergusii]
MARIQIPIDVLTSRLNLNERFNSVRSGSLATRFSNMRPLSEFLDVKRINKPANFAEMQSRVNYNLGHFSSNYAVVFAMLCIYSLLTNFWLLFDIIFVVVGMFVIGKLEGRDLEFGQQRFSTVQLYTGLYVIAIPIALISGVFGTMMWLIGASGVVILGHAALLDKPIDEAFSGEARRTYGSRRGGDGEEEEGEEDERWWGVRQRVVEEVDSDDEGETHGAGPDTRALSRRVTGAALGNGDGVSRPRRGYAHQDEEEDETTDESDEDSDEDSDGVRLPLLDSEEEALADAAMARIRRAQAKGKQDVKLTKQELAAYQRKLQLLQMAERRQRREQRVTIPISQLGPSFRQRRPSVEDDSPPQQEEQPSPDPPMGYFPPPASRSRRRSGTTSSTEAPSRAAADSEQSSSPFTYTYVRSEQPARVRQGSETDPFQYMTAGSRTPYPGAAAAPASAASGRNGAAEVDDMYASYGSGGGRHSGQLGEPESSDDAEDHPRGARVASGSSRSRHKDNADAGREPAPEPRPSRDRMPPPGKKPSAAAASSLVTKKKPIPSSSTKPGRKKGK